MSQLYAQLAQLGLLPGIDPRMTGDEEEQDAPPSALLKGVAQMDPYQRDAKAFENFRPPQRPYGGAPSQDSATAISDATLTGGAMKAAASPTGETAPPVDLEIYNGPSLRSVRHQPTGSGLYNSLVNFDESPLGTPYESFIRNRAQQLAGSVWPDMKARAMASSEANDVFKTQAEFDKNAFLSSSDRLREKMLIDMLGNGKSNEEVQAALGMLGQNMPQRGGLSGGPLGGGRNSPLINGISAVSTGGMNPFSATPGAANAQSAFSQLDPNVMRLILSEKADAQGKIADVPGLIVKLRQMFPAYFTAKHALIMKALEDKSSPDTVRAFIEGRPLRAPVGHNEAADELRKLRGMTLPATTNDRPVGLEAVY